MKKQIVLIAAAFAALFAVSCTKETPVENAPVQGGMKEVTITASVDQESKTAYGTNGAFSWTKGDQISVLCSDELVHTFTATSAGASTTFTGYLPEGVTLGDQAFFPANDNHAENSFYLAATSEALDASLPMVGTKSEGNSYQFAHCSGGFQFTFKNIPENVTVLGAEFVTSDLKISGTYEIWTANEKYVYGVYAAANDAEKQYARKVRVANGEAKVYLPYGTGGDLWGDTTLKLVGYDAQGNATELLTKDMKLGGKSHSRAVVIPVIPYEFPKPSPLASVDWESENVTTYVLPDWFKQEQPTKVNLTELKAVADADYLYVRVKCADPASAALIRYYFADTNTEGGNSVWYWESTTYGEFIKSSKEIEDNLYEY